MLGKVIQKFKKVANKEDEKKEDAKDGAKKESEEQVQRALTGPDVISVIESPSSLNKKNIEYALEQVQVHEKVISELIDKISNMQQSIPGAEFFIKFIKLEKRIYEHDEKFMLLNANLDSVQSSCVLMNSSLSAHDDFLSKLEEERQVHASGHPEQKNNAFNSQGFVIEEINSKLTSLDKQIASLSNSTKAHDTKEASDKYPISVYNDFKAMMKKYQSESKTTSEELVRKAELDRIIENLKNEFDKQNHGYIYQADKVAPNNDIKKASGFSSPNVIEDIGMTKKHKELLSLPNYSNTMNGIPNSHYCAWGKFSPTSERMPTCGLNQAKAIVIGKTSTKIAHINRHDYSQTRYGNMYGADLYTKGFIISSSKLKSINSLSREPSKGQNA